MVIAALSAMGVLRVETLICIAAVFVAYPPFGCGQYLQIYPEKDSGDGTKHLYMGLMQSFGGGFIASATVPAVQVALDEINANPTILPGYTLHYTLSDSQVGLSMQRITCM